MNKWKEGNDYIGQDYSDYFVSLGQTRDSNALEQSNFNNALKQLGGESDTVLVIRNGHWAVGWIEWIGIHKSDNKAISTGENIEKQLSEYLILDEEDYCQREHDYAIDTWKIYSLQERIALCKEYNESIFAARNTKIIFDNDMIYNRLID
jgi:hypothetical protein|tara:strand:- start:55 stop:504 length:450 start_codon:yes stop_codon:yes gene_type:complete